MQRFVIVHNIPSPYRLHLFRVLKQRLEIRGYSLSVHFMARSHRDRPNWAPTGSDLGFDHTFHRDVGPHIRGKSWHLNPDLLSSIWNQGPEVLMVGGPWDSLTSSILTNLPKRGRRIAWVEGNTQTPGRATGSIRALKAWWLAHYDVIATPGRAGAAYAKLLLGGRNVPIANLPNLVDETIFMPDGDPAERERTRTRLGVSPTERLAIWPARLVSEKGIPEFLSVLTPEVLDGWKLAILGDGPLRQKILNVVNDRHLGQRVSLWNYWDYSQMPALYRAADLMLLPSKSDLNPLSIVEALHSGLPLLVSNRIGNHAEALLEGKNGWTVDPGNEVSVLAGARKAFGTSVTDLRLMGNVSRTQARHTWHSEMAVDSFLDQVGVCS